MKKKKLTWMAALCLAAACTAAGCGSTASETTGASEAESVINLIEEYSSPQPLYMMY